MASRASTTQAGQYIHTRWRIEHYTTPSEKTCRRKAVDQKCCNHRSSRVSALPTCPHHRRKCWYHHHGYLRPYWNRKSPTRLFQIDINLINGHGPLFNAKRLVYCVNGQFNSKVIASLACAILAKCRLWLCAFGFTRPWLPERPHVLRAISVSIPGSISTCHPRMC